VIGGKDSGMSDASIEGVTGWLVDGTKGGKIAQAMQDALSHPELVQAYGAAALQAVRNPQASWKYKAIIVENIINNLEG
jgi:glycosyltransferase involved in cell wall biosynthesis